MAKPVAIQDTGYRIMDGKGGTLYFDRCGVCGADLSHAERWTVGNPREGGRVLCYGCNRREAFGMKSEPDGQQAMRLEY